MNTDFIKELYCRDILNRRKRDYLNKAKEIGRNFEIIKLSENQIKCLERKVLSAKNIDDISAYLIEKEKKAKPGQGWGKIYNGQTLARTILDFITGQICDDANQIGSIRDDIDCMDNGALNTLIESTRIRLTAEFIKYLSGCYKIGNIYQEEQPCSVN